MRHLPTSDNLLSVIKHTMCDVLERRGRRQGFLWVLGGADLGGDWCRAEAEAEAAVADAKAKASKVAKEQEELARATGNPQQAAQASSSRRKVSIFICDDQCSTHWEDNTLNVASI